MNAVANGDQVLTEAVVSNFSLLYRSMQFLVLLEIAIMLYVNNMYVLNSS